MPMSIHCRWKAGSCRQVELSPMPRIILVIWMQFHPPFLNRKTIETIHSLTLIDTHFKCSLCYSNEMAIHKPMRATIFIDFFLILKVFCNFPTTSVINHSANKIPKPVGLLYTKNQKKKHCDIIRLPFFRGCLFEN